MTIAEIHGKLSSSGSNISDHREDLLTADVFGCLRYLPFEIGIQKILTQAQRCFGGNTDTERLCITDTNKDVVFRFWPQLEKSEPDVLIEHGTHLIMIEVKYLSGKSGHYGVEQDNEDSMEAARSDQLGREFQDLMDYGGEDKYSNHSLIYLSAHRMLPEEDVVSGYNTLKELTDGHSDYYKANVYWLSWFEVYKTVSRLLNEDPQIQDKYWRIVLCDIHRLLHRKGLRQFEGFEGVTTQCKSTATFYPINQPIFYRSNKEAP